LAVNADSYLEFNALYYRSLDCVVGPDKAKVIRGG